MRIWSNLDAKSLHDKLEQQITDYKHKKYGQKIWPAHVLARRMAEAEYEVAGLQRCIKTLRYNHSLAVSSSDDRSCKS